MNYKTYQTNQFPLTPASGKSVWKAEGATVDRVLWIRNFRVTFILRFFHFRIIREFLNSRASIRVVGYFRGLKIGALVFHAKDKLM